MERLRREQEIWEEKQAAKRKAEVEAMEADIRGAEIRTRVYGNILRREYCEGVEAGTLDPERAADLRKVFAKNAEWLRECGVKDLPINGTEPANPPAKSR